MSPRSFDKWQHCSRVSRAQLFDFDQFLHLIAVVKVGWIVQNQGLAGGAA
jgi:hypothetical protein